jgi:hypothetical protein
MLRALALLSHCLENVSDEIIDAIFLNLLPRIRKLASCPPYNRIISMVAIPKLASLTN